MSKLTNYGENQIADFFRGQGLTLPASWHFALGNAADDTGFTEITGTDYARVALSRSLTNFSGTQGAGTTAASSGTSHETRNNVVVTWPTAGAGGWTAASKVGLYDAASAGNCWVYTDLDTPVTVAASAFHTQAISSLAWQLGLTGGMTDYLANKLIDLLFRAQSFTWAATNYLRLVTTLPTNASGGVEVTGGAYARVALASSLSAISGTQSAGSTSASSGSAGRISNNGTLAFPSPTANWGLVTHEELMDASSGGNRLFWSALAQSRNVLSGGLPLTHAVNTYGITIA